MLKNVGTIRIIDPEAAALQLASLEVEITFNKQGPTGNPGHALGWPSLGRLGRTARTVRDGHEDGAPFSGTFTSPNGQ